MLKSLLSTALLCLMTTITNAQEESQQDGPSVTQTTHQDWQSICVEEAEKAEFCLIRQQFTIELPDGKIAGVTVIVSSQNDEYIIEIKLPLGLDLRNGLTMQVDDIEEINLPFTTCVTQGCIVMSALDKALVSSFKSGSQLQFRVMFISLNERVNINASLLGFSRALLMLK